MGRIGIYGVSLFYILSGLTMYLVYYKNFTFSKAFFKDFYIKRFFRIFPLMWFVVIICYFIEGTTNTLFQQLIIVSGLFSVFDWAANTPMGMWSIGNELSFYLLLPFIFVAFKTSKIIGFIFSSIIFLIYIYFAFFKFDILVDNVDESYYYKNPLNQAALFVGGILIGYFFKEKDFHPIFIYFLLFISILLFCFYPCNGELGKLYSGLNRIVFTLICYAITIAVFKLNSDFLHHKMKNILHWLGEISYSLYLLHGCVWSFVLITGLKIRYVLPISIILSFLISHYIFSYLESPARKIGYRVLKKNN
jgi:peptidoglycan/LPS O-acetylase OafA/YrhL